MILTLHNVNFYQELVSAIRKNIKTCFEKFKGKDLISVERNGLMLSTLRKRL